jgi:tyrosinase
MTIAAAGPVVLSNAPTEVVLETRNLATRLESLAPNRHIYVVLRELHADVQPDTLYHVYLGLTQGAKPEKGDPHEIGILNFYNAVPLEGGAAASGQFRSFDVTALLKNLQQRNALTDRTTVTIVPSGVPAPAAKASIGRVEMVEQ